MRLPARLPLATSDHFKIVVLGEDGCPIIPLALTGKIAGCLAIATAATLINSMKPDAVVISDCTTWLTSVTSSQWKTGFQTTLKDLKPAAASIAVMGDIQIFNYPVIACLSTKSAHVQRCTVANPNTRQPSPASAEKSAAATAKVTAINPTPWLCTATKCPPAIGGYSAYWDNFPVSVPYACYLTGVVGRALSSTLKSASTYGCRQGTARARPSGALQRRQREHQEFFSGVVKLNPRAGLGPFADRRHHDAVAEPVVDDVVTGLKT
jgi:hypothetical protein